MVGEPPPGRRTLTPRIFTQDVAGMVGFLRDVFDAQGVLEAERPTELQIGDSLLMVSDGGGVQGPTPAFLYVYVDDCDAAYQRALERGATVVEEPNDQFYGDRRATVADAWGNTWQIATRIEQ